MKKLLVFVLAMAVALSFGSMAMAKDGLSVDLGFAWNFNGADMGKTIAKDGEEGQGNGIFGDVILSDNTMLAIKKSNSTYISKVKEGGSMQGLNTALRARYDFMNAFFARLGFVYDMQLSGGEQEATVGSAFAALGMAGDKVKQTWTYGMWAIPLTVGINVPVNDGKFNIYAGLGLTYYSGYWQLEAKAPAGYIDVNGNGPDAVDVAAGPVNEKCKFEVSGIGFNWTVGTSAEVYQDVALFIELDATVAAGMADAKLKTTPGQAAFGVTTMAYPVNLSTQLVRFGVNYKLPVAL